MKRHAGKVLGVGISYCLVEWRSLFWWFWVAVYRWKPSLSFRSCRTSSTSGRTLVGLDMASLCPLQPISLTVHHHWVGWMQASLIRANPSVCAVWLLLTINVCFCLFSTLMEICFTSIMMPVPSVCLMDFTWYWVNISLACLPDVFQRNLSTIHSLANGLL